MPTDKRTVGEEEPTFSPCECVGGLKLGSGTGTGIKPCWCKTPKRKTIKNIMILPEVSSIEFRGTLRKTNDDICSVIQSKK